jgi:tRNA(Ile)-lysidine synthase
VEHGIRPPEESRGDALAVAELCRNLKISLRIVSIAPGKVEALGKKGIGLEAAARFFRRRAWTREARRLGAERVLTAHTRDDLLETILMRMLQGAGPGGLAAMPRTRGLILRPLLGLDRADVLRYLREEGLPFRTDSTNGDIRFLRNRIRLKLIPCLDRYFPGWKRALLSLGETQRLTADFLSSQAEKRLPWEMGEADLSIPADLFFQEAPILREEALFQGADLLAPPVPPRRLVIRAFARRESRAAAQGGLEFEDRDGFVRVRRAGKPVLERGFSLLIKEPGLYTLKSAALNGAFSRAFGEEGFVFRLESPPWEGDPGRGRRFPVFCPLVLRPALGDDFILKAGRKRCLSRILDRKIRSHYTDIITVEDFQGPAAFVGLRGKDGDVLLSREEQGEGIPGPCFFVIPENAGGNDERSER